MDRSKRVVQAFINSGERYFNKKTIIENNARECAPCGSEQSNDWNYKDIRDITKYDLNSILAYAKTLVDKDLLKILPDTALNAALQISIQTLNNGQFQNKIDAVTYDTLMQVLMSACMGKGL